MGMNNATSLVAHWYKYGPTPGLARHYTILSAGGDITQEEAQDGKHRWSWHIWYTYQPGIVQQYQ